MNKMFYAIFREITNGTNFTQRARFPGAEDAECHKCSTPLSFVINKKLALAAECSGRGVFKLKFQGDDAAATEYRRPANNIKLSRIDSTLKRARNGRLDISRVRACLNNDSAPDER